ncbi:MAG: zf-HC2 domain-containing protein [Chloroflexota bacterium]|nr:zf-HC2 domain-containing protein [Chloroflexota bacterium]MDQ6906459.1 zf-HC2 domain-containing protein [Chloroflexota bacterium]
MHCKPTRKLLLQSLEQPLDAETRHAVQAHVEECAACRQFVEAMDMWPAHASGMQRIQSAPDLTERVLSHVRPLPPPWVYRQQQQSKQMPHVVAFAVGALGVVLTFLMLCLTFVVAIAGDTRPDVGRQRQLMVPEVWHDVRGWMDSVPNDHAHAIVTLIVACAFVVLVVTWFRTLADHVGRDRQ